MKKILSVILVTTALVTGCSTSKTSASADKKASEDVSFEYSAMTRGAFKKVIVKKDTIVTVTDRAMKTATTKALSNADWNSLVAASKKVKAESLETLEVPSKKHQFDGALAANLQIIKGGTTYQSATFDDGNPPAEIKELVEKIIALSDLNKGILKNGN
ncbi:hypothetical protein FMM05_18790 [Flavobacterium zepuense]|uniref:Lipoprotein n=1 Tax=Flavobacterium zepuense TaxID=2593302 RepID=A0A552UVH2_9FLAO|nr:hypothetical protein [Flavobacterium zepuense]TRW22234.1 hypothetical protein FMM05_18790 [Flavobacterium zepuense]